MRAGHPLRSVFLLDPSLTFASPRFDFENAKVVAGRDSNTLISPFSIREDSWAYFPCKASVRIYIQSFNDIFKSCEAKTGKELEVTYKSAPELQAALTSNPHNLEASYILSSPLEGEQWGSRRMSLTESSLIPNQSKSLMFSSHNPIHEHRVICTVL
ncbi:hypothetical protein HETIRDRAFT_437183 [Heterobasidion irregulare TC 32-1]|uniref:Uncharacterized protein n=1 Tax=Heterobasidion irregulare (strain TC 32-1) TaxID=747525 RepID=W4JPN2_HETIT|nr:uncharacterized protein HETIRDRAFT_437183 [Heterobasidion irregulare TC 32-1]ETW75532.1 hypothetical protein HETIRDRAFT_437183 [Heterobasidion irregulare TC 32-1]